MLRINTGSHDARDHLGLEDRGFEDTSDKIDVSRLISAGRRQSGVFILCCSVGLIAGGAYLVTAVPKYTASTDILIDNRQVRAVQDVSSVTDTMVDTAAVDSQVEVLGSEKIAQAVVQKLKLADDPDFMRAPASVLHDVANLVRSAFDVTSWLPGAGDATPEVAVTKERLALENLLANLSITRVGRTYVLEVTYTAADANRAAQIANAFADAYLTDQLNSRFEATRRASVWLQQRIGELRVQASDADLRVQKFRSDNNLIAADGKLVSDQQLTEVNTQLTTARSDTQQAEARYQRIRAILDSHDMDAAVTESLRSPIIGDLRGKYLDASKREREITSKLGPNHLQAISERNQMQEYQRLIFEELGRIAQTYQSDFQVAKTREESLTKSLAGLVAATTSANQSQVKLRQLEQDAESFKTLYQTFLAKFQEATQQQSFPMTDARIITEATPPRVPSQPKKPLMMALALVLGAFLGIGLGALREMLDHAFRTGEQIRDELGAEFFGMLPALGSSATRKRRKSFFSLGKAAADPNEIQVSQKAMRYVLEEPMSGFAETLRSVKIAADLKLPDRKTKVIGVISALPGEGKSTVAKNLASLLASQGSRTLLIDGDLRNPSLTRSIAGNAEAGLLEALIEGRPYTDFLLQEPASGLRILPAVVKRRVSHTSDILASVGMRTLLSTASENFDYVVLDLPPTGAVVDARAAATVIDGFVFVVEWGKTARRAVRNTFSTEPRIREKILGIVLNKVQLKKLRMYENFGTTEYYHNRYKSYYRSGT